MIRFLLVVLMVWAGVGDPPLPTSPAQIAFEKGLAFLVKSQNPDGSWGSHSNPGPNDEFWWNHETHRSWQRATSALCCMALLEFGKKPEERKALEKGIQSLVEYEEVKRPSDWDVDNTWSYVYGLQALSLALLDPQFQKPPISDKIKASAEREIAALKKYQAPNGGWGYYDFETLTKRPSWATSFMTAVGVLALLDAKKAGLSVDESMLSRAVKAVARCRLPTGAYTYSVEDTPSPGGAEWIDQVKGSLGRIQVGNLALFEADEGRITKNEFKRGLEDFFAHHKFLEIARRRPIPHEAYYYNSGYFYFFGHYYAAQVIGSLEPADRPRYWPRLQQAVASCQEPDGSMWDYYMNSYHKPYGTAFAVMALGKSLKK